LFLVKGIGPLATLVLGGALFAPGHAGSVQPSRRSASLLALQCLLFAAALLIPGKPGQAKAERALLAPATSQAGRKDFFIEAEACESKSPNLVIHPANDAGGHSVLSVPQGSGKGVGAATYQLDVPAAGSYKLWLRVLWEGGCSNSILCQIDDGRTWTVEDAIFERWHWVDVAPDHLVQLPAGPVPFRLKVAEDGVHVDQIAFLADPRAVPVGILTKAAEASAAKPAADTKPDRAALNLDDEEAPQDKAFDKYGK